MKGRRTLVWVGGIVIVAVALALLTYFGVRLLMPEIVVANQGQRQIDEVVVTLPSSRVVFGSIASGQQSTIYYDAEQADGTYQIVISLADGTSISTDCGYVTNSEVGKGLRITLSPEFSVQCQEYQKF